MVKKIVRRRVENPVVETIPEKLVEEEVIKPPKRKRGRPKGSGKKTKKKTSAERKIAGVATKSTCKSIDEKKIKQEFNRQFIISQLLDRAKNEGISGVNALKELRSLLTEEQPAQDIDLNISFVPIVFDGYKFHANLDEEIEIK